MTLSSRSRPLPSSKTAPDSGQMLPFEGGADGLSGAGEAGRLPRAEGGLAGQGLGDVVVAVGEHPLDERGQRQRVDGGDPVGLLGGLGPGGVAVDGDAALVEQPGEGAGRGAGRVGVAGGGAVVGVVEARLVGHQRGDGGDVLVRADGVLGGARVGAGVVAEADLGEVAVLEGAGGGVGQGAQIRGLFLGALPRGAGGEGGVAAADQDDAVLAAHDDGGVDAVVGSAYGERGDGGGELDGGGGGGGRALVLAEDLAAGGDVQDGGRAQRAERRVLQQRCERVGQPGAGGYGGGATARGAGSGGAERGQHGAVRWAPAPGSAA